MVLIPTCTAPSRIAASRPFSPSTTDCTAASSASMVTTMRAPCAASRGVSTSRTPSGALPCVRFHARTSNPASARFFAIGEPMRPRPQKPTRSMAAKERLDLCAEPAAEQRAVDAEARAPGLAGVWVVPERGEVQALEVDVAHFAEVAHAVLAVHAAEAGGLHAAPRRLRGGVSIQSIIVHHGAGDQLVRDAIGLALVAREHVRREAVGRVVGH